MKERYKQIHVDMETGKHLIIDEDSDMRSNVFKMLEESSVWIIPHNLNTNKIIVEVSDLEHNKITSLISKLQITDMNTITIEFPVPTSGYANVLFF